MENNPNVNAREESNQVNQSTPPVSSASGEHSERVVARIAELEGQLETMRAALDAAGLLKDSQEQMSVVPVSSADNVKNGRVQEGIVQVESKGSSYEVFVSCKPPVFQGGEDPLVCRRWIRKMEQIFDSAVFTEGQKVRYSIRLLEGEALDWWESVDQTLSEDVRSSLTWDMFVERLSTRFCSEGAMQHNQREFLVSKKGNMSISMYNTTFAGRLQSVRRHCPIERSLITQYVEGLPSLFKSSVRNQATLDLAMKEAKRVEDDLMFHEVSEEVGDKRKRDERPETSSKKKKFSKEKVNQKQKTCNIGCRRCGKMGHMVNDCRCKVVQCYNCQELGHFASQCSKPDVRKAGANKRMEVSKP
jgi:hypothetical protein